jgi:pimeloyl-ACP methyl ester carboxylesterase
MRRAVALLTVYLVACAVGGAVLTDRALTALRRRPVSHQERLRARAIAASARGTLDSVAIRAADGGVLHGWLLTPGDPRPDAVLLLHGIGSTRGGTLSVAQVLLAHGYPVLMVDLRAHGESGGALVTFGALEADDTRRWVGTLRRRFPSGCVFSYGGSLGASVALQASDAPGLCAVVAEAPFANVREITYDRAGQQLHAGDWLARTLLRPGVEAGLLAARLTRGVDLSRASATAALASPGPPVLLIHGTADANVPPRHTDLLARAGGSRTTVWRVPGGGHANALGVAPADFVHTVTAFLAAHRHPTARPSR